MRSARRQARLGATPETKPCEKCGKMMTRGKLPFSRWEERRFCSRQCYYGSQQKPPQIKVCQQCGAEYRKSRSIPQDQWDRSRFCSTRCWGDFLRIDGPTKECADCGRLLPYTNEFYPKNNHTDAGLSSYCKVCMARRNRNRMRDERLELLKHYSGGTPRCACCGESRVEFLVFDHINGGGNKHRKEVGSAGIRTWLRRRPEGVRVLCDNCNASRGRYGYCPHQTIADGFDILAEVCAA